MSTVPSSTSEEVARLLGPARLLELWRLMLLNRRLEERLSTLYRQGRIVGGLFRSLGQEAISVGAAAALERRRGDLLAPMIRNLGALLVFGCPPREILTQYMARATSPTRGKDNVVHFGSVERGFIGPISHLGTLVPVMAGMGLAGKMQGRPLVTLTWIGDGGSSTGDFHEGMNFAAVTSAPLVVILENNGYAYSTPVSQQTAVKHLADKAAAYGIPAETIDGNDVLAVYEATHRAAARARAGLGPSLLEAITFRMAGHAEHDDAAYVPRALKQSWEARDPLLLYQRFLVENRLATEEQLDQADAPIRSGLDEDVAFAENSPMPRGATALTGVYAES